MSKIEAIIEIPEELYATLSTYGFSKEVIAEESRKLLALKWYKDKKLSLGKAAELSSLSKWDFIEFLSKNGVPVITHEEINLKREFEAADNLIKRLKK